MDGNVVLSSCGSVIIGGKWCDWRAYTEVRMMKYARMMNWNGQERCEEKALQHQKAMEGSIESNKNIRVSTS